MRRMAAPHRLLVSQVPRGWVVLGAAMASWVLVALLWSGLSHLLSLVAGTI